jgi:hypothetical protein
MEQKLVYVMWAEPWRWSAVYNNSVADSRLLRKFSDAYALAQPPQTCLATYALAVPEQSVHTAPSWMPPAQPTSYDPVM